MPKRFKLKQQYKIALTEMLRRDGRRRGKHVSERAATKTVKPSKDNNHWIVTGGANEHVVRWTRGRFECSGPHPDGHRAPDRMCTHELAVYRHVAHQFRTLIFDEKGYRRADSNISKTLEVAV